jgi:protein-tyrosine phosphatase
METSQKRVPIRQVCFVCTGNLYRSKYAEAWFNNLCIKDGVTDLRAFSRGLAAQPTENYEHGEAFTIPIRLAIPTYERMVERNIPFCLMGATNVMLSEYDCASSNVIVLMNKDEHLPKMQDRFPDHLDKIQSYEIGDKCYLPENGYDGPEWEPVDALDAIENLVSECYKNLR